MQLSKLQRRNKSLTKPVFRDVVTLSVRQDPKQAVVTPENKEKMRKPVDPPPIVQLHVDERHDREAYYLVSPFLFMSATVVEAEERDGAYQPIEPNPLIGSFISSLHRLKDIDNKDGAFFVFGDISCRREGIFRMQFSLFEMRTDVSGANFVDTAVSEPFKVVPIKEFRGLMESTHLSRTFSDQGVRLRLRKEARNMAGSKRTWDNEPGEASNVTPYHTTYNAPSDARSYAHAVGSLKRHRTNSGSSFPSAPFLGGPVSHYSSSANELGGYGSQSYHPDQYQGGSGLSIQPPTQEGTPTGWSRSHQQGPYTAPVGSMGEPQGYGAVNAYNTVSRSAGQLFYDQSTHQYSSRASGDSFGHAYGLHTPTSGSDGGLAPHQSSSVQQSGTEGTRQEERDRMTHLMGPPMSSLGQSLRTSPAQYGLSSSSMMQGGTPSYASAHDSAGSIYGMHSAHPVVKTEYDQYGLSGQYPDSAQDPYASGGNSFSDSHVPLNPAMMSRGFVQPPTEQSHQQHQQQQAGLGAMSDEDLSVFKAPVQAYPTPHQTSPLS